MCCWRLKDKGCRGVNASICLRPAELSVWLLTQAGQAQARHAAAASRPATSERAVRVGVPLCAAPALARAASELLLQCPAAPATLVRSLVCVPAGRGGPAQGAVPLQLLPEGHQQHRAHQVRGVRGLRPVPGVLQRRRGGDAAPQRPRLPRRGLPLLPAVPPRLGGAARAPGPPRQAGPCEPAGWQCRLSASTCECAGLRLGHTGQTGCSLCSAAAAAPGSLSRHWRAASGSASGPAKAA